MSYSFSKTGSTKISYGHLSALDGAAAVTLSFWYKPSEDASTDYGGVIGQTNAAFTSGFTVATDGINDTRLQLAARNAGAKQFQKTSDQVTLDAWNHVYVVYDGGQAEASRLRMWVNGTEITSWTTATAAATIGTITEEFLFGYNGYNYRTMLLAEVAMWIGEAVTTGTVISDLASGVIASTANPTGLDFHVRMNSSGDVNDSAGSLTGTVTNATYSSDHPTMSGGGGSTFVPQVIMIL